MGTVSEPQDLLTIAEAATRLGVSEVTIRRRLERLGAIPATPKEAQTRAKQRPRTMIPATLLPLIHTPEAPEESMDHSTPSAKRRAPSAHLPSAPSASIQITALWTLVEKQQEHLESLKKQVEALRLCVEELRARPPHEQGTPSSAKDLDRTQAMPPDLHAPRDLDRTQEMPPGAWMGRAPAKATTPARPRRREARQMPDHPPWWAFWRRE